MERVKWRIRHLHLNVKKRLVKKQPLLFMSLLVLLVISSVGIGAYASQMSLTVKSQGTINYTSVTFILRYVWIGAMKSASDVDQYVAEHPWGNAIILTGGSSGIYNIIRYTGYDPNKAWTEGGSFTYKQLKEVIDRFHYHGWKVIYSAGSMPTKTGDAPIWNYINNSHRELAFTDGNGKLAGLEGKDGKPMSTGGYRNRMLVNFFAKYTTLDEENNISVGARLIDVYCERLRQMISDKSFEWDGWFGVDGWNGFTVQGYYWLWSTNELFGRWIGTSDVAKWYDCSYQAIEEWKNASDYYHPNDFPPEGWSLWNNTERGSWIRKNANLKWWEYWMDCFAQMYAKIRQVFVDTRPEEWRVGTIIAQDMSSTWADNGVNNLVGMENLTAFAKYGSFDHYYIDCEWDNPPILWGRRQAYCAGLVKSKIPEAHCIVGFPIQYSYGKVAPTRLWKQQYLAQVQTYVWKNGSRYRAVDPNWILVWAPTTTTWDDESWHGQEMATWITKMSRLFSLTTEPVWLGPVEVLNVYHSGTGLFYYSINYTFAQFTDIINLKNHPSYITNEWKTICLDAIRGHSIKLTGIYETILQKYASGALNVIVHFYDHQNDFDIYFGEGGEKCRSAFRLGDKSYGSTEDANVLSSSEISDPVALWIASGYYENSYTLSLAGIHYSGEGFESIVNYTDGRIALGISYNSSSGRFLYGRTVSNGYGIKLPRDMINKAIYWVSDCPINTSEPLLDLKVFKLKDGTVFIPMMNLRDFSSDLTSTLKIDATALGLITPTNYKMYWQSNIENTMPISDWNNIPVTLRDGADILVIAMM